MKRLISLLLVLTMVFTLTACSSSSSENDNNIGNGDDVYKVALLVHGQLGDKSFFDSANHGLQMAKEKYGDKIEVTTVEMSGDETKWTPTLLDYCDDGSWDLIITGAWAMLEKTTDVALQYPEQKFLFFDEQFDFSAGDLSNVYNVTFRQNEISFMAGALAGMMTKTENLPFINPADNKIGFIGGVDNTIVNDFLVGYIQGAKYVNPDVKVITSYIGSFLDSAAGKDLALVQYGHGGVDISYAVAGTSNLGVIDAAYELNKYMIGVDSDQAALVGEPKADNIPTSAVKNIGNAIFRAIELDMDGELPYGETEVLGFRESGIELVKGDHYEKIVPEAIRTKLDEIENDIVNGNIVVDTAIGKTTQEINAIKDSVK